ncbi:unnamed protein product [Angiostrongylus costaricensis]|uniref:Protein JTB n=1 Tax=Angiostrongylus costaricensis TaxID=334426 RepID=A0A0R3PXD6_ANGCS|nr:unnamed protein product [Angiostrongylus costaricensis]
MAEKCDVLEYYRSKRLFSFIIALICFTVIVVFVEEYAEEGNGDSQIKSISKTPNEVSSTDLGPSGMCWLNEKVTVIDSCVRCSEFEMNAFKAKHCTPTGFYDRVNCSQSGIVAFRPCKRAPSSIQPSFYCFMVINVVLLPLSYLISVKRIAELNRLAYTRVTQSFEC